ncbi:BatA domain-containing protein [Polaribacter porphyrae]|uniref:Aerotolerance regulator N-terminal domain-containing protein n=1 Tax=Polaribacter porphyrae TaxID=1137780 RepID=A0A2S7WLD6_9FLAO|nr:BatA domain-containing protein [Polaribacter porphyrae]PQJ78112.1 hypothetical protein BTO18_02395 [Polaribacter porphyrae]
MQFKNPEVLYFLWLLIIPILVHLFQLQKFVKVPFTNVAFLKKLIQETRKSSRLKKLLILATRMLLFSAIFFAFSQPYFSNKNTNTNQHTFIYLDNSLSTNTKGEKGNLLQVASQEIIDNANTKDFYSLQTNANFYQNISYDDLKKELLNLKTTSKKLDFSTILLKIANNNKYKTNTLVKNILISDFQYNYKYKFTNVTPAFSAIQLTPSIKSNLSVDSLFVTNTTTSNFLINVKIKNVGSAKNNIPIAIFNHEKLISKQTFSIDKNSDKIISFTVQNQSKFLGKIQITFSDTFNFDNTFYFSLNTTKKINVLSIGKETNYLSKIYTNNEFNFTQTSLKNINYNSFSKQQIIILNELDDMPTILGNSIVDFSKKGGTVVIIPSVNLTLNTYNSFLSKLGKFTLQVKRNDSLKITNINYNQPFFKNVFSKNVQNFQYPVVKSYYPTQFRNGNTIVSFENNLPFISQVKNSNSDIYFISSAISKENSNFLNSPLIVPVFYNFAKLSFQHSKLYNYLDDENTIDVDVSLNKDEILTIKNDIESFIPPQQTFQNKVKITTKDKPLESGFYYITNKIDTLNTIAYNTPKEESSLNYFDLKTLQKEYKNMSMSSSIPEVFTDLNEKNEVQWLWKWFLALAIVSLLLEILILKFYKP